jgi:hypothetical protein
VRVQLALEELKSAKRSLAELEMAYEEEDNTWNTMIGGCALIGGACMLYLIWQSVSQGFFSNLIARYEPASLVFIIPIAVVFVVAVSGWIACAPAGYIGSWRMIRSSGWFVVGGGIFWLAVLLLFMAVPVFLGPYFLKRQWKCVRELKSEVCAAKKRLAAARAAIS